MQMFGIVFGTKREHMVFNASKLNSSTLQSTGDASYCSNPKSSINEFPPDLHLYETGWTHAWFKQVPIVKFHPGFPDAYKWWILGKIHGKGFEEFRVFPFLFLNSGGWYAFSDWPSAYVINSLLFHHQWVFLFFITYQSNAFKLPSLKCTSNYLQTRTNYPKPYAAKEKSTRASPTTATCIPRQRSQGCSTPRRALSYGDDLILPKLLECSSDPGCCITAGEDFPLPEHNPNSRHRMICTDHSPALSFQWHHRAAGFISSPTKIHACFIL